MVSVISAGTWLRQKTVSISAHCATATRSMKWVVSPRSAADDRHQQEGVDRDEDRVEAVPFDGDQVVLDRQDEEERRDQRVMVAAPALRQRDEFAQRGERGECVENDHADRAEQESDPDQDHHHPPRLDALVQVLDDGVRLRPARRASTKPDDACDEQHAADAEEEIEASAGRPSWLRLPWASARAVPRGRARGTAFSLRRARASAARRR